MLKSCLFFGLMLLIPLSYCSEEQLRESRVAEQLYLDLLYAIEQGDENAAFDAVESLELQLNNLRGNWRRPMSRTDSERCRSHLDAAETAFAQLRKVVKKPDFIEAKVLVNRAVNEIQLADGRAFEALYLGKLYPFYSTWEEVRLIVNDQMLCLMEWKEYAWWANLSRSKWQEVKDIQPDPQIYQLTQDQQMEFDAAKVELSESLQQFGRTINRGDQCISQEQAVAVDAAIWKLIRILQQPATNEGVID